MTKVPEDAPPPPKEERKYPRIAENRTAAESTNRTDRIMGAVVDFLAVGLVGPLLLHGTFQTILVSIAESTGIRFRELRGGSVAVMVMGLTQFVYFGPYLVWTYRTKRAAAVAVVIVISGITVLISGLCASLSGFRPG